MTKWIYAACIMLVQIGWAYGVCQDINPSCAEWIQDGGCGKSDFVMKNCRASCGRCNPQRGNARAYDPSRLPEQLKPVGFLLGRWRAEFEGKARFPTIPIFTYGEQIDYSVTEDPPFGVPSLNYSSFAWSSDQIPLHSEYGTVHVKSGSNQVALTTVMSNGFITVEEGTVFGNTMSLTLNDIGRISWSRDLPVLDLRRECTLIDKNTLDCRLTMQTLTNILQEHTYIRYTRIM